jgi:hypothetical protein
VYIDNKKGNIMFVLITINKATNKNLDVELYPVETGECFQEMLKYIKDIKSQGFKCEYHRVT